MWHLIWKGEHGQPERKNKGNVYFLLLILAKNLATSRSISFILHPEERRVEKEQGTHSEVITRNISSLNSHVMLTGKSACVSECN